MKMTPLSEAPITQDVLTAFAERFWSKVDKSGECWTWTGSRARRGYGQISLGPRGNARNLRTHRVAWELNHGPIPDGLVVCHSCDNPPCCNPAHLWLGTQKDNMQDAGRKGRATPKPFNSLKTHCPRGHEYSEGNVYTWKGDGKTHRGCRECRSEHARRYELKRGPRIK